MPRYAVLLDLDDPFVEPIALVTEHNDCVRLHFAEDRGLRSEYTGEYRILEPDGSPVVYFPGRPEYFDHVLMSLGRTFVVTEVGEVPALDRPTLLRLYVAKVALPRASREGQYEPASQVVPDRAYVIAADCVASDYALARAA